MKLLPFNANNISFVGVYFFFSNSMHGEFLEIKIFFFFCLIKSTPFTFINLAITIKINLIFVRIVGILLADERLEKVRSHPWYSAGAIDQATRGRWKWRFFTSMILSHVHRFNKAPMLSYILNRCPSPGDSQLLSLRPFELFQKLLCKWNINFL